MVKRNAVVSVSDSNVPQVFSNDQFGQVRIVMQDNGEPLFCLKDACDCLDLAQPSKVASRLDKDDVHSIPTLTEGGMQEMLFITESGLYDAILGARKNPKTKPFKKWVTKEVLPSIRKTGGYNIQQALPTTYLEALEALVKSEKEKQQMAIENKEQKNRLTNWLLPTEIFHNLKKDFPLLKVSAQIHTKSWSVNKVIKTLGWLDDNGFAIEPYKNKYICDFSDAQGHNSHKVNRDGLDVIVEFLNGVFN